MRILATLIASVVLVCTVSVPANAADVVHTGTYWSWTGPKSWKDAQGAYGITILGGSAAVLDLGFSTTLCASGKDWDASVRNHFKAQRKKLTDRGARLTKVGRIVAVGGDAFHRRQTVELTTTSKRKKIQGIAIFDYDFTTNVDGLNYCYQRSEARTSLRSAWKDTRPTLARVSRSLAYFGPGA